MRLRINIVYRNNNMPAEVLPPIPAPDGSFSVTWSRRPQAGSDAVVYFNHYAFHRRLHERICPGAMKILYMYEPAAVDPMQYTRRVWRKFDAMLTWNTYLTRSSDAFTFESGIYYDLPYCSDYGVPMAEAQPDSQGRERALCQICGDKYSLAPEELYSLRRRVARWFARCGKTRMDVYGKPPMNVPNYRGACASKAETFRRYRYALCFENTHHPLWTQGYLTEKILDCMSSGTIPVYFGCSNIEELVPEDCFLDYRRFASLEALDDRLQEMSDEEYLGYAARMRAFILNYNPAARHSAWRLYEAVAALARKGGGGPPARYPEDYIAHATMAGRCRLEVMRALLPLYRYMNPLFALVRSLSSGGRR